MKKKERVNADAIIFCLIIAVAFVYFASSSTSPLFPYYYGGDSAQFQTIGKAWYYGKIPYVDMFDHKGPLIFFIDMLGYSLTKSSTGIMFLQMGFMFATMMALLQLGKLGSDKKIYRYVLTISSLMVLSEYYSHGNMTEEYCLPFIILSLCYQTQYLQEEGNKESMESHKALHAMFYGITVGICFLTKVTNAVAVCAGVLLISIILLKERRFKNIFANALAFVGGFLALVLPFLLYFAQYGAAQDFLYATLLYNFEYKSMMTSWVDGALVSDWIKFLLRYFGAFCIIFAGILLWRRKKYYCASYYFLCGVLELYIFLSGALFPQYAIITLPQFGLLLNEITYHIHCENACTKVYRVCFATLLLYSCVISPTYLPPVPTSYDQNSTNAHKPYKDLLESNPEKEKDSFVAYGDNELKDLYLLYDMQPYYKYFVIQEWHASFSEKTKNEIHETFADGNVKWILTDDITNNIQDVLDNRYELYKACDRYKIYCLK